MSVSLIVVIALVVIVVLLYNSLVAKKNQVENIFASVDVLLKKRYDLLPNLVASVSEYMEYEKDILTDITKLRAQASQEGISDEQKIALDEQISSRLGSIMVAVESYPQLRANDSVMHLQATLNEIEEQISAARRAYNQAVTDYNNALEMIPTNFMANAMGYTKKELFKILDAQKENLNIKELFER